MATYPKNFIGPLRPDDKREDTKSSKTVVVNPSTGRSWGSVEEYVKAPKKYGGGSSGGSSRSFNEEFAKRQAEAAARQAAATQAAKMLAEEAARQAAAQEAARQAAAQKAAMIPTSLRPPVRVTTKTSRDVKTGEQLIITETRGGIGSGKLIRDVKRGDTTTTNVYAPGRGGGSVGRVGGYSQTEVKQEAIAQQTTTTQSPYTLSTSATDIMKGKIFVGGTVEKDSSVAPLTSSQQWGIIGGGNIKDILSKPEQYQDWKVPATIKPSPAYASPGGQAVGGTIMNYGSVPFQGMGLTGEGARDRVYPKAPSITYMGGQELFFKKRPLMHETISTQPSQDLVIRDISPDYSRGVVRKIEESIPGFGTVVSLNEQVYLPDSASIKEYNRLIGTVHPKAGGALTRFLRDQQAQRKKDIGELNVLNALASVGEGLDSNAETRRQKLIIRLEQGSMGTGRDILYTATESAAERGETASILGVWDWNPRTARRGLKAGLAAYDIEKEVLAYQVGAGVVGVGLGAMGSTGGTIAKVVSTVGKPLKYAIAPLGLTYGTLQGAQEYKRSGDIGDAFAVGLGSVGGYFGAVYSKQIVEGFGKFGSWLASHTQAPHSPDYKGPRGKKGAKGSGSKSKQEMAETKPEEKKKVKLTKQDIVDGLNSKRSWDYNQQKMIIKDKDKYDMIKKMSDLIKGNPEALKDKETIKKLGEVIKEVYGEKYQKIWNEMFIQTTYILGGDTGVGPTGERLQKVKIVSPTGGSAQATIFGDPSVYTGTGVYETTGDLFQPFVDVGVTGTQSTNMFQGILTGGLLRGMFDTQQESDTKQIYDVKPIIKTKTGQDQDDGQESSVFSGTKSITRSAQSSITSPAVMTIPKQDTGQASATISSPRIGQPRTRPDGRKPIEPPKITPVSLPFWWPGEKEAFKKESLTGYHASVKQGNKWKRVTPRPHTRMGAMDMGARLVDNTTSAQWRIEPIKQTKTIRGKKVKQQKVFKESSLAKGDGYFRQTQDKYRNFSIIGGRRKPLGNTWIEKRGNRNDTRGEASGLVLSQAISRGVKRSRGLPVRRNKGQPFRL